MIARILSTPIPAAAEPIPAGKPRHIAADVLAAVLPEPGRDRLARGEVLAVTTGQQPGLFTGPLYTIHKALSAIAFARRLETERGVPVVPVFWVAGDDHDFAEANHAWVLGRDGEPVKILLRERAHEAPQLPLFREQLGGEIAAETPERLSPNVLLRPVIEAALFPTLAYVGGPGEMDYLQDSAPLFSKLGVAPQARVPRWSRLIIEARVDKVLSKHGLTPADFNGPPGALEARFVQADLPPDLAATLQELRQDVEARYARISGEVQQLDPTLERTVQSARNAALAGTNEIERKLVASLKRSQGTLLGQLTRVRAALAPGGKPQERVLTVASFLARYGGALLDDIDAEVARWAAGL